MLSVYDINTTTEFIHPHDTSEPKTTFILGVLGAKEQAYIDNQFTQLSWVRSSEIDPATSKPVMQPSVNVDRSAKHIAIVKLGLKGVKEFSHTLSFVDEQYPFGTRKVLDDASLNAVKPYITELALQIEKNSNVTAGDKKK